ncbi:Hypothetical predicted protein [Olea europaea subsp. europaea]|uniref:Uncharacterized protein n=1 Tax=Olea europaea subsp. europaea TaxID=158383 RepID=A0A8S0PXV9_OLEEU|nr:Hypothetical predicted protein [Olea europaea subsp. europaea]
METRQKTTEENLKRLDKDMSELSVAVVALTVELHSLQSGERYRVMEEAVSEVEVAVATRHLHLRMGICSPRWHWLMLITVKR